MQVEYRYPMASLSHLELLARRQVEALLDDGAGPEGRPARHVARLALEALTSPLVLVRAERRVVVPAGVPTVGVVGARLGGSGRTPVAIACVEHLCSLGVPTALVGHGYGAQLAAPTRVSAGSPAWRVGDEAVVAARALAEVEGAVVVVGPTRAAAAAFALREGRSRALVLDGALGPKDSSLAVLARPVGRSRLATYLGARADATVVVGAPPAEALELRGTASTLASLAHLRYGLTTGIGRPSRVVRALEAAGSAPRVVLSLGNHGRLTPADEARAARLSEAHALDLWLATEKGPLLDARTLGGRPLALLRHRLTLPEALRRRLAVLVSVA